MVVLLLLFLASSGIPGDVGFGHRRADDPTPGLAPSTGRRGAAGTPAPISPGGG